MATVSETNLVVAAVNNFKIFEGDTFSVTLTFIDGSNAPIVLTGSTIKFTVNLSENCNPTTPALVLTETNGITIGGTDNNQLIFYKQLTLTADSYKYTLEVTFPSGKIVTYLKGAFNVIN